MKEILFRFVIGGAVVSFFAILGDVLKPKSFAGLLGAAPSVALATLSLTVSKDGKIYAQTESHSMILGGVAFFLYAWLVSWLLVRKKLPVLAVTALSLFLVGCCLRPLVGCDSVSIMKLSLDLSVLQGSTWHEYVLRFIFGGAVTATTGIVAKHFGPEIGGLFLAFPAIFPASATLIEKHERDKKRKAGLHGTNRGREAAGLDAAGAALGSIGLIGFASPSGC